MENWEVFLDISYHLFTQYCNGHLIGHPKLLSCWGLREEVLWVDCLPSSLMWCPQMVALFWKVVEPLGRRHIHHWRRAFEGYIIPSLLTWALCLLILRTQGVFTTCFGYHELCQAFPSRWTGMLSQHTPFLKLVFGHTNEESVWCKQWEIAHIYGGPSMCLAMLNVLCIIETNLRSTQEKKAPRFQYQTQRTVLSTPPNRRINSVTAHKEVTSSREQDDMFFLPSVLQLLLSLPKIKYH